MTMVSQRGLRCSKFNAKQGEKYVYDPPAGKLRSEFEFFRLVSTIAPRPCIKSTSEEHEADPNTELHADSGPESGGRRVPHQRGAVPYA